MRQAACWPARFAGEYNQGMKPGSSSSRRFLIGSLLLLLAFPALVLGQGAVPPPISPSKTNAGRLRWMQYSMVAGRVVVSSAYLGTNMTFGPGRIDGREERLQVQINAEQINLRYELTTPDEQFSIALVDGKQLSIRRTCSHPSYSLHFEQQPDAPLSFSIDSADVKCSLSGDSFWHLYLAEPEIVRRHLAPLLEVLHPAWQLAAMGAAIEEALLQQAQNPRQIAAQRWTRLVDDLASPQFSRRQRAQRELYDTGPVVVPFLQKLDRSHLDAEQAARVRALVESLSVDCEDTSDRVAIWLAGDVDVWLSSLSRPEPARRRGAKRQLDVLTGSAVDFNPDGDETERGVQIERLRTRLQKQPAEKAAATKPPVE